MRGDIRQSPYYCEAEALHRAIRSPGEGKFSECADLNAAPDGSAILFTGALIESFDVKPRSSIGRICLQENKVERLTAGSHSDRLPRYSPDGGKIAFLSDRAGGSGDQLFFLDFETHEVEPAPEVVGTVEYFQWSHDGTKILLGVAGPGADTATVHGATISHELDVEVPPWLPEVRTSQSEEARRRLWTLDCASGALAPATPAGWNIWEAAWLGSSGVVAIASEGSREGDWYGARLIAWELEADGAVVLTEPRHQLGCPAASPNGRKVAFIESVASDRLLVCGPLHVLDAQSGRRRELQTDGADVGFIKWLDDENLLLAGLDGLDTVVATINVVTGAYETRWRGMESSLSGNLFHVASIGDTGDFALVEESFVLAPRVVTVMGREREVRTSFNLGYEQLATAAIGGVEPWRWQASDGLEMQGWLLRPQSVAPYPLILNIHGGPVLAWRPMALSRFGLLPMLAMLERGYAVFFPNPRGSAGRGSQFAEMVLGDLCGADATDLLTGVDSLIASGIADESRLSVTGISYGGTMTAWLITQSQRFSAAIAVAPGINRVSQRLTCAQSGFLDRFLADKFDRPGGNFITRSPVMHAAFVTTPTLLICGALDRCTPPSEAMQFYTALAERKVPTALATYPTEGHGIRSYPPAIDYSARVVDWLEKYAGSAPRP